MSARGRGTVVRPSEKAERPHSGDWSRFWSKVDVLADGCWIWTGAKDKDGYGRFQIGGKGCQIHLRAHRVALSSLRGESTALALHSCDVPACCNPWHLRWGTQQENRAESKLKNRTARGERNGNSTLTISDVREIRAYLAMGHGCLRTSRDLGHGEGAVAGIAKGTTWRYVS